MKKRVVILILTLVFLAGAMAAAGLPLVGERLHAEQTTTYGVGELMARSARTAGRNPSSASISRTDATQPRRAPPARPTPRATAKTTRR